MSEHINIIFDGPPSHEAGRFVEVETDDGRVIGTGECIDIEDGLWEVRIPVGILAGIPRDKVEAAKDILEAIVTTDESVANAIGAALDALKGNGDG